MLSGTDSLHRHHEKLRAVNKLLNSKCEYSQTTYTKINTKCLKDLNVKIDTIKLLEEIIGRILFDINHSNIFLDPPPSVMKIGTKINKWDLSKQKLSHNKGNHQQNKKTTHRTRENICKQCDSKRLISKIYKHFMQLTIKITNNPIKKWAEDLNRHFSKEDMQMAKKIHKRMLNFVNY